MNDKKKVIVLGGTLPHVELINKLKNRGYYVILIDYLDNSPGIAVANQHIQESTLDKEKVLEIAKNENVEFVISTCIDQANSICCYVGEKLNLPIPYSFETSLNVTDKSRMKKIFVDNGIPTSLYTIADSVQTIDWSKIKYPAVVKPVDCNSSKGVYRAENDEEVTKYVLEDLNYSRSHKVIIESFVQGVEIQVDCFATDEDGIVLMTRQKKKLKNKNGIVLQSTGSIIPAQMTQQQIDQCESIAKAIAKGFNLKNTPFFYQAIITEEGISVLEFAPRIGGGLSYCLIQDIVGVDSIDLAINSFMKIPSNPKVNKKSGVFSTNLLYMKPGTFHAIEGFEDLKKENIIEKFFQNKKDGTIIDSSFRSGNRIGAFIVQGDTLDEVIKKEKIAYSRIKILDNDDIDLLNRKLYEEE